MVSQKFVDAMFPGCLFGGNYSPRSFLVEQVVTVGRTQGGHCALCGLDADRMVAHCAGTPFRGQPCSDIVREHLFAVVTVSKKGRLLPYTWIKDIVLDF